VSDHSRSLLLKIISVDPPLVSQNLNDYQTTTNTAVIRNAYFLSRFIPGLRGKRTAYLVIENTKDDRLFIQNIIHEVAAWLLVPVEIRKLYVLNKIPDWRKYLPSRSAIVNLENSIFNSLWKQK